MARHIHRWLALVFALCAAQVAQSQADPGSTPRLGVEASIGALYQDKQTVKFDGGSSLRSDQEFGVIGAIGYSFSPRFDLLFGFDSASISYELTRQSVTTPGQTQRIRTEYDQFTPYFKVNYNFTSGSLAPYVSASVGWSFIDTNIPTGNTFIGCWWDPWWGYFCAPFSETKRVDAFAYSAGVGARWMINDTYGLRFEYQKQWLNLPRADGTPDYDQLRLTFVIKYW